MTILDTQARAAPPSASAAAHPVPRRWWILAVLALAQLMVVLDATVVNIALPSAQHALGFSTGDRQWVVTAYSLAFGSLLLLGGRLSDLLGRRQVLITGMVGFAGASALGGAATGLWMLVAARAIQGAFGALLAPAALALLTTTFTDPLERGKAFGIYGAIAGTGGAAGLILGGGLTEYLDWRWCLYVNLVIAVVALAGALTFLPATSRNPRIHVDWLGTATIVAGLVAIVYGFSEADTRGWADPVTLALLAIGAVLVAVFAVIESKVTHPLLPLRVLADRNRGAANVAFLISGIGTFGVFLFVTYYAQQTLHFTPLTSGLAFLPMVGGVMVSSISANAFLLRRFGPRWPMTVGMVMAAAGLLIFSRLGVSSTYGADLVPGLIVAGLGLGLVFGTGMDSATNRADPDDAGVASAMVNVGQQVGGSIGTALLNTLATSAAAAYIRIHGPAAVAQASVHGEDLGFTVAAAVFAVGAVAAALLFRPGPLARPQIGTDLPVML